MQLAARSSFAAGVAIVGAGILVAAPVRPPMPDLPDPVSVVRSAAVELSALANPLAALSPLVRTASDPATVLELGRSAKQLAVAPSIPVLGSLPSPQELLEVAGKFIAVFGTALSDAPAQIQTAVKQISAGQITAALDTLVNIVLAPVTGPVLDAIFSSTGPLVDLVGLLQRPFQNVPPIRNVIGLLADPDFLLTVGLGPLQSVYALTSAVGGTAEAMLAAVKAGNPGAFVSSFVKGIGDVTEAVIDRLLNPGTPPYGYDRGLIAGLIEAGKMIFAALTTPAATAQPATAAITATPVQAAATVTLSTAPADADAVSESAAESVPTDSETPAPASDVTTPASDVATPAQAETKPAEVPAEAAAAVQAEPAEVEVEPAKTSPEDSEEAVTVSPIATTQAPKKPAVRTGIVAVPGKVTVGVGAVDKPADVATQPNSASSGSLSGSPVDTASHGSSTDSSTSSTSGASGHADGADNGGSGSSSGDSE
jgi:hypothetical protein